MSESKAERKKKSDIASVVNYFEESDLTEEELINLSKDMNRIANEYAERHLKEVRSKVNDLEFERDYNGISEHFKRGNDDCVNLALQIVDQAIESTEA